MTVIEDLERNGINGARVEEIYADCLAEDMPDSDARYVIVEGILNRTAFNTEKLDEHRDEIAAILAFLPEPFQPIVDGYGGGGWSFLNACEDRKGHLWGQHQGMDMLFQLGIGLGLAKWLMPREMWSVLPGGMPYVAVYPDA